MSGNKNLLLILALSGLLLSYLYNHFRSNTKIGAAPIVETAYGKLVGSISISRTGKEFYEYLGIPYAQPPIGEKRFEPPEPPIPWEGVKDATSYGEKCLQVETISNRKFGSENCLFLNIFAPKEKANKELPVMVYIHGGIFETGSSNLYGPLYFMDEQVVIITFNYRLSALGFLNTGDSVVRGNMGLKDQLMALVWVKMNVKNFGGDPNRVTIFGNSSGGVSVNLLILSPRSKGLFSKAIAQSGTILMPLIIQKNPIEQAHSFADKFGCSNKDSKEMISCLRKVDGEKLVIENRELVVPLRDLTTLFLPTIETYNDENTFLSEDPLVLLEEGRFNKIPMISGVNSEDGLILSAAMTAKHMEQTKRKWTWWISKILAIPEDDEKARLIRKFYFGDINIINKNELLQNYTNLYSDRYFFEPVHRYTRLYSKHASIRLYYYTYKGHFCLGNILLASQGHFHFVVNLVFNIISCWFRQTIMNEIVPHMGSAHADEIPLLFNDFFIWTTINIGDKDYDMSAGIVKLWVSFATIDDSVPLKYKDVMWLRVNSRDTKLKYLQLSTKSDFTYEPFADRIEFWKILGIPL